MTRERIWELGTIPAGVDIVRGVVHLLCFVERRENREILNVQYSAMVSIGGSNPEWLLFNHVGGSFVRYYARRKDIEEDYPYLVWRRQGVRMRVQDYLDQSAGELRREQRERLPAVAVRPSRAAERHGT